jgi:hypothetical protein
MGATQSVSVKSKKTGEMLEWELNRCFLNADNHKHGAYKKLNLKLVIGSLGLNGFDEFGGRTWTEAEWVSKGKKLGGSWDAHAWLQDDKGNIYDYCFENYIECALIQTGRRGKMFEGLIEGLSRRDCLKRGLTYTPAPLHIQEMIWKDLSTSYPLKTTFSK